jgi:hypothetical protein
VLAVVAAVIGTGRKRLAATVAAVQETTMPHPQQEQLTLVVAAAVVEARQATELLAVPV